MTLPITYSTTEVAEALGVNRELLLHWARIRPDLWPSLKLGRRVRFTEDQVAFIVARCTRNAETAGIPRLNSFGRVPRRRALGRVSRG